MPSLYKVIGLMSGTSLDGLDLAFCSFELNRGKWNFSIMEATTIDYHPDLRRQLERSTSISGEELVKLDLELGRFFGAEVNKFMKESQLETDLICSHGHTVFHQPEAQLTHQIGNGQLLANLTGCTVINDFRSQDVLMGGQGAPLVPIGDQLLFPEFRACLNFGGIANISFEDEESRTAYDICPANMPLNYLAAQVGIPYDEGGLLASKGNTEPELLTYFNSLDYYDLSAPKSLGYEWVNDKILSKLDKSSAGIEDKMRTIVEHISDRIAHDLSANEITGDVLCTGGGALNAFLMGRIESKAQNVNLIVPSNELVQFKEALVFGFLGVLRAREEVNVLASVTGAPGDHSAGRIYEPY